MKRSIVVVGGGISGLASAYRVLELCPDCDVVVLEATSRTGGLIGTDRIHDCIVERGADSILTEKPAALDLARRVGIESEVIGTNPTQRGAYVVHRGRLERIPDGFSMMAPSRFGPILTSPILSLRGKLRMLTEPLLPRGSGTEESVGRFVRRRFGREVLTRLAQPLMGGIYGTDVELLSLQATMPRFSQLEAEHRSVTLGLLRKTLGAADPAEARGARYSLFVSFKRGTQTLTDAVSARLGDRIRLSSKVTGVARRVDGMFDVHVDGAGDVVADGVVLALPARVMARLTGSLDPVLSERLLDIPYGSTAAVYYAFERRRIAHALDAFGFVVPKVERRRVLASTWASVKFEGRAPPDQALIRVFFGGDGGDELLDLDDRRLVTTGIRELEELIGLQGEPLFTHVTRHPYAMPKYVLGHADRVLRIEKRARAIPGLALAGNSMYGVGIPDAIRSGERAAENLIEVLKRG